MAYSHPCSSQQNEQNVQVHNEILNVNGTDNLSNISSGSFTSNQDDNRIDDNVPPINLHTNTSGQDVELLIFIDSNRNHINWRRFWTLKGTTTKICGSLFNVEDLIRQDTQIRNLMYVLISVGVNGIDVNSVDEVFCQLQKVVKLQREKYNSPKIIVSEITPRTDAKDEEVKKCNVLINDYVVDNDFIFLANHSNLRSVDGRMFSDEKHITRQAIPIFVTYLKKALWKAYNIQTNYTNRGNRNPSNSYERPLI